MHKNPDIVPRFSVDNAIKLAPRAQIVALLGSALGADHVHLCDLDQMQSAVFADASTPDQT
jgi:hypothetical protein